MPTAWSSICSPCPTGWLKRRSIQPSWKQIQSRPLTEPPEACVWITTDAGHRRALPSSLAPAGSAAWKPRSTHGFGRPREPHQLPEPASTLAQWDGPCHPPDPGVGAGERLRQDRKHGGVGEQGSSQTLKESRSLRDTHYPSCFSQRPQLTRLCTPHTQSEQTAYETQPKQLTRWAGDTDRSPTHRPGSLTAAPLRTQNYLKGKHA